VIDMASISTLIDFLMSLMRDEDTKQAFAQNPGGTLADKGLQDVSAEDVRDARLIMADTGHARPRPDSGQANGFHEGGLTAGGGNSAVREIMHTTNTFEVDQSKTIFNFENNRTTILDSFNSADKVTAIQDNDTVIDIDKDGDEDEDDKADDKAEDKTEDKTEDETGDETEDKTDEPGDETDEPRDGDEQEPAPGPADEIPGDGPPPADEVPGDVPSDPGPPTSEDPAEDPEPEGPFPTEPEPEPVDDAPVIYTDPEPEDLPVA
jgi:hypothetical protein